jgi:hypothetical protein
MLGGRKRPPQTLHQIRILNGHYPFEEGANRPVALMPKLRPSLPADQAFVVQVHVDAEVGKGRFFGRTEHIVSGQATHFDSVEALVAFITRVLEAQNTGDDKLGSA